MRHIPPKKISALLDKELTGIAAVRAEQHLAGCAHCRLVRDEMLSIDQMFRAPTPAEPPVRLWDRIASRLGAPEPARPDWLSAPAIAERFAWAREQVWAMALVLVLTCCVSIFYWSSENARRQQLAQIDRICQTLLPPDVKSYNPFTESPLNHTAINPFVIGGQDAAVSPAEKPREKR